MLTILRVIDQHRLSTFASSTVPIRQTIKIDAFKIIYVCVNVSYPLVTVTDNFFSAPMKALASEIVRKLGKRLAWLSIKVRELTGEADLFLPTLLTFYPRRYAIDEGRNCKHPNNCDNAREMGRCDKKANWRRGTSIG